MKHRGRKASWFCPTCDAALCNVCVIEAARAGLRACPYCGDRLKSFDPRKLRRHRQHRAAQAGHGDAAEFFLSASYPFQGRGKWILLVGTVLFLLLDAIYYLPGIRAFKWYAFCGLAGYLLCYMMKIVGESARGEPDPPGWPDLLDIKDDQSLLQVLTCVAVSFSPWLTWLAAETWSPSTGSAPFTDILGWVFLAGGGVYFPMSLLAVCLWGQLSAVGPHMVLPAIARIGPSYLVVSALLIGLLAAFRLLAEYLLGWGIPGHVLLSFTALYCMMLVGRLTGLLYDVYGRRLEWFD